MTNALPTDTETERTRQRYDRIALVYDWFEALPERVAVRRWRRMLWDQVEGPRVLEIGIGTGKNIPYYPSDLHITGVDLSPNMLRRAQQRKPRNDVELVLADAQDLPFPDAMFDSVVATFVFCSVPDPIRGLKETARVLKPGGQLILLEHVLSQRRILRQAMRALNPVGVRVSGANYDRETVTNVHLAGFEDVVAEDLCLDVVKLIEARSSVDQSVPEDMRKGSM